MHNHHFCIKKAAIQEENRSLCMAAYLICSAVSASHPALQACRGQKQRMLNSLKFLQDTNSKTP